MLEGISPAVEWENKLWLWYFCCKPEGLPGWGKAWGGRVKLGWSWQQAGLSSAVTSARGMYLNKHVLCVLQEWMITVSPAESLT